MTKPRPENPDDQHVSVMSDDERYSARRAMRAREREFRTRVLDQAQIEEKCSTMQRWWFEDFKRKHGLA
jgi:hypothetical protein